MENRVPGEAAKQEILPVASEAVASPEVSSDMRDTCGALLVEAEAQPELLAARGAALGLDSEGTKEVFVKKGYQERQEQIVGRLRRLAEAVTMSLALGAAGGAYASPIEAPTEPVRAAVTMEEGAPVMVGEEQSSAQEKFQQAEHAADSGDVTPDAETVETPPEQVTQGVEQEGKAEKRAEIFHEAADGRFRLFTELVTTVVYEGATSEEAMKKLSILAGRPLGNEKGEIAEAVVTHVVPLYDGVKTLLEAAKGSTFDGKELSGVSRLTHLALGVAGLVTDAVPLGAVAKILGKLSMIATVADKVEQGANDWTGLLQMIEKNPHDPDLYKKVIATLEKQTTVGKARGAIIGSVSSAYGASQRAFMQH